MAVIWIDEFEDGRMESPIGTTLYEHRQIEPTEHALKPDVPYIASFGLGLLIASWSSIRSKSAATSAALASPGFDL